MTDQSQEAIGEWHAATWPGVDQYFVFTNLVREWGNLDAAVESGVPDYVERWIGDVYVTLAVLGHKLGTEVPFPPNRSKVSVGSDVIRAGYEHLTTLAAGLAHGVGGYPLEPLAHLLDVISSQHDIGLPSVCRRRAFERCLDDHPLPEVEPKPEPKPYRTFVSTAGRGSGKRMFDWLTTKPVDRRLFDEWFDESSDEPEPDRPTLVEQVERTIARLDAIEARQNAWGHGEDCTYAKGRSRRCDCWLSGTR